LAGVLTGDGQLADVVYTETGNRTAQAVEIVLAIEQSVAGKPPARSWDTEAFPRLLMGQLTWRRRYEPLGVSA